MLILVLVSVTAPMWLSGIGYWLDTPSAADLTGTSVDVIVVAGGNPERTRYGFNLYHEQHASHLWHTGFLELKDDTEQRARWYRVPRENFVWLASTSTWEDGEAIAARIKQEEVDHLVLITDWWHSRRVLCSLQTHLDDYSVDIAFRASPHHYGPDNWWHSRRQISNVLSELAKFGYYWLRYDMAPTTCLAP
jgi:uncharacterized SAM-binding protein YcdF (DUF218 family)